jgi:hypothetical protein
MRNRPTNRPAIRRLERPAPSLRVLIWWYGAMALAGLGFGFVAEGRPFGDDVLAHPLVVYFIVSGIALLVLRVALARPVTDLIPERVLVIGCFIGLALFLVGNFLAVRLLAP